MDVVQTSLYLFAPPATDKSIVKEYWVDYNPIAAISEGGVIELSVPVTSIDYINGVPTDNSDQVAPVNFNLHSIFRQFDLSLNQKLISPDVGLNYPYKALIDLLLGSSNDIITGSGSHVI